MIDKARDAGEAVLRERLIADLASTVEKRLDDMTLQQAAMWLAGYFVGRSAHIARGATTSDLDRDVAPVDSSHDGNDGTTSTMPNVSPVAPRDGEARGRS